ncbi:hypothetical protein [Streptomyces atratus]|uniref:hypothetical protein n=1 Tax=Streptomyces atratus TaxID=1893 RepID=UPI0033F5D6B8
MLLLLGGMGYSGGAAHEQITVSGDAMQPTYRPGERLVIEHIDQDKYAEATSSSSACQAGTGVHRPCSG